MTTNNLKTGSKYTCKYCGRQFTREKTLAVHLCEPKRRMQQQHEKWVQVGYATYQRFYSLTQGNGDEKTYEHFAKSAYYNAFVKFGKHLLNINPVRPDLFIDYVIKKQIKLDWWCKDKVYQDFLAHQILFEDAQAGMERTIKTMRDWAEQEGAEFNHFFEYVNLNRAVHMIQTGKISPWVLFSCKTGKKLLNELNDEQIKIISDTINPAHWKARFKKQPDDYAFVKEVLVQAGIE